VQEDRDGGHHQAEVADRDGIILQGDDDAKQMQNKQDGDRPHEQAQEQKQSEYQFKGAGVGQN